MLARQGSGEDPLPSLQMTVSSFVEESKPRCLFFFLQISSGDFPGGPVVKNPTDSAGDMGSTDPWSRKVLHAVGAIKPMCHNY